MKPAMTDSMSEVETRNKAREAQVVPFLAAMCLSVLMPNVSIAAVGCTLNDPDRDISRIFPSATGYKTEFITLEERGGQALADRVEARLGDKLHPVYEAQDVPYAYYTVLKGKEAIGRVHGVNQKGTYGDSWIWRPNP